MCEVQKMLGRDKQTDVGPLSPVFLFIFIYLPANFTRWVFPIMTAASIYSRQGRERFRDEKTD